MNCKIINFKSFSVKQALLNTKYYDYFNLYNLIILFRMKTTAIKGNARIFRLYNSSLLFLPENPALPFSHCIFHSHNENL